MMPAFYLLYPLLLPHYSSFLYSFNLADALSVTIAHMFSSLLQWFFCVPNMCLVIGISVPAGVWELRFPRRHFKPLSGPDIWSFRQNLPGQRWQLHVSLVYLVSTMQRISICLTAGFWLRCKPVEVAYVHTLLETASYLCHSWSLEPVTWQKKIACGFSEKGERTTSALKKQASDRG